MSKPNFDFSGQACRWIDGDPQTDGCQCRKAPAAGRPYCPAHQARAYIPASAPRKRDLDPWAPAAADAEAA
jgi:hypothetical protein